jgi:hypothetical protein
MADRSSQTSKMILSLITSSAAIGFGNWMMRCTVRGPAFPARLSSGWLLFLAAPFRITTGHKFLPFRKMAIDAVAPSLIYGSVTAPSPERRQECGCSGLRMSGLGLGLHPRHHDVKEQLVFAPTTHPVDSPTVDHLAQGGRLTKPQIFRLDFQCLLRSTHIHGSCPAQQSTQKSAAIQQSHTSPVLPGQVVEEFTCLCGPPEP